MTRYQEQASATSEECDQLRFEMKKIERAKKYPSEKLRQHFDKELEDRAEKIKLLDFQLDQLDLLPLGSELKEKEVQGISRVQVVTIGMTRFKGRSSLKMGLSKKYAECKSEWLWKNGSMSARL